MCLKLLRMKFFGCLLVLFFTLSTKGQDMPMTTAEKATLDSMLETDEFLRLMKEAQKPTSYFLLSAGIGNSYFSVKNRQLNASQLENKTVFTGSAGYFHKSGISLTASSFLFDHLGKAGFYQYSITPAYNYTTGKTVDFGLSYSHYFKRKSFENVASPVHDEIYANINLKKPWIQPGIALGYASGKYTEYLRIDTVINGIRRIFIDTANVSLTDFSITGYVQHKFVWYNVFDKQDGLSFIPQLLLNAGVSTFNVEHQNPFITRLVNRNPDRFKNAGKYSEQSSLAIHSVAGSIGLSYAIGKIGIQSQAYLDYYIPESTDKKFTAIYSIMLSYIFD